MMVVDSSAIIAILFDEPEGPDCTKVLEGASARLISAVNYVETGTVLAGRFTGVRRSKAIGILDEFLTMLGIGIAPVDDRLARAAMKARIEYGQGLGTRGGLNFGDCFAYALARQHSAPLLYIGNNFGLTDIRSALEAPNPKGRRGRWPGKGA
ncbi:type II toxin-antitoxin system VapC family toxin [Chelativorans alearense]|uniref:type II toxin-antitoxin system VapC family toxin n=1 Tax=Chelativorans alearense TaxID=2681495 RepID=UPI0013CFB9F1|nr:type II toxin-antitoxin system VapC family toxin [Chelativorans alearense]